ncbi:hypothetical protein CTI12_AA222620 [Artemisia annua]|uniref:Uncharacterized protein n=1 Tax=Artemisia annua TaxID=35608 RepID=A0A2U1NVQ9_ARTAN|nr:hypothetical protein CTI12_AA222620 [Artemisia annua]
MGKGSRKGKKFTLTKHDDAASGEEERIPIQKRRGRPQKPLEDEDDDIEKIEDEENTNVNNAELIKDVKVMENGKKRKRNKLSKDEGGLVKDESGAETKSNSNGLAQVNSFRHARSRRKNKPHRAAEAGVPCI